MVTKDNIYATRTIGLKVENCCAGCMHILREAVYSACSSDVTGKPRLAVDHANQYSNLKIECLSTV